jgi:hypothetical protein
MAYTSRSKIAYENERKGRREENDFHEKAA